MSSLNAELSPYAGLLSEPLGDPPALEPSATRKVRRPLLHSPPQLHLGKGSVTPGTRFCSDAHLLLFIQRALKSDPVSLTWANLYKGTGDLFNAMSTSRLQKQRACVSSLRRLLRVCHASPRGFEDSLTPFNRGSLCKVAKFKASKHHSSLKFAWENSCLRECQNCYWWEEASAITQQPVFNEKYWANQKQNRRQPIPEFSLRHRGPQLQLECCAKIE